MDRPIRINGVVVKTDTEEGKVHDLTTYVPSSWDFFGCYKPIKIRQNLKTQARDSAKLHLEKNVFYNQPKTQERVSTSYVWGIKEQTLNWEAPLYKLSSHYRTFPPTLFCHHLFRKGDLAIIAFNCPNMLISLLPSCCRWSKRFICVEIMSPGWYNWGS